MAERVLSISEMRGDSFAGSGQVSIAELQRTGAGLDIGSFGISKKKEGLFRTLFAEEIGGVGNILSIFNKNKALDLITERIIQDNELTDLLLSLPDGNRKERVKRLVRQRVEERASLDIVGELSSMSPAFGKTSSQIFGEVFSLGLLVTPVPEIKAAQAIVLKPSLKLLQKTVRLAGRGGVIGGFSGFGFGLAQEGELEEKFGLVAVMTGLGFLGGALLEGVIPAVVGGSKQLKKVYDYSTAKLRKTLTGEILIAKSKVVLPILREVTAVVGKVKTKVAIRAKKGLIPINKEINELQVKISDRLEAIDNLIFNDAIVAPKAKARTSAELGEKTAQRLARQRSKLQTQLRTLEKKRDKLLAQSIYASLEDGSVIFSKEKGRFKIVSFFSDLKGRPMVIASDVNGRLVTLLPDDMLQMKRIIEPVSNQVFEVVGLPKIPVVPHTKTRFQDFMTNIKAFATTRAMRLLADQGEAGQVLAKLFNTVVDETNIKINKSKKLINKVISDLKLTKKKTAFTKKEIVNIIDILDIGLKNKAQTLDEIPIKAINERVKIFLEAFSETTKALVSEANELGLKIRNPITGKNRSIGTAFINLPHILVNENKFRKNLPELIGVLTKRHKITKQEASRLVNVYMENFSVNRFAGLEKSRTLFIEGFDELEKFGFSTDPFEILEAFTVGASKRIVEARRFGAEDQILAELRRIVKESGYDDGVVKKFFSRWKQDKTEAIVFKRGQQALRAFQTVTKLPLAAIINTTQVVNPAAAFGIRNTAKGFKEFIFNNASAKTRAELAGVSDAIINGAIEMAGAETKAAKTFLRKVGFTSVEKFNRIVSVIAGQEFAKDSLNKLIKEEALARSAKIPVDIFNFNPRLARNLERLGVNVKKAVERGRFTEKELATVGQNAVTMTQFRGSLLDVPLFWSSPYGKTVVQFKSFAFQQGLFIKDVIWDEMRNGNYYPFITYLVASQITGEGVRDVRSILKADFDFRKDMPLWERMIDNQLTVGGIGLTGDLFRTLFEQAKGNRWISAIDLAVGPTVADIAELVDAIGRLSGGDEALISKFGLTKASLLATLPKIRDIPGAGAILRVMADVLRTIIREQR